LRFAIAGMLATLLLMAVPLGSVLASATIQSETGQGLVLGFDFAGATEVRDDGGRWAGLTVPEFLSAYDETLGLTFPGRTYLIAVPVGAEVRHQVVDQTYSEVAEADLARFAGAAELLERLPANPVEVTAAGYLRNQRTVGLRVTPLVYDRASGRLRVYGRLSVKFDFPGSSGPETMLGAGFREEGTYEPTYRAGILNYQQGKAWRRRWPARMDGGDYFSSSSVWFKIKIASTGIYCVTGQDLADAGATGAIASGTIRLYTGGGLPLEEGLTGTNPEWMRQVPVRVADGGDGAFGSGDSVIFYGLGTRDWADLFDPDLASEEYSKSFYSDTNYYWLTWGGSFAEEVAGMDRVTLPACDGCDPYVPRSYLERVHVEQDNLSDFSVPAEDGWYWRPLVVGDAATVFVRTPSPDQSRPIRVNVRLADWHRSDECRGAYFRVILRLNGVAVKDSVWATQISTAGAVEFAVGATPVAADSQRIDISTPTTLPAPYTGKAVCERLYLAWCEAVYWRKFTAAQNRLFFVSPDTTATVRYELSGFTTGAVYAFDVTDQFGTKALRGAKVSGGPVYAVAITDTVRQGAQRRYAVVSRDALLKPAGIVKAAVSDIRHDPGAEYCVVTNADFIGAARRLADLYDSEVVTVDQIYDEFGWGVPDATSIRDFLRWRLTSGSPIARVLLVGDATWDIKGYLGAEGTRNYVPTYERRFLPPVSEPYSTDDWLVYLEPYADSASAYWPTLPIARIPAGSADEAEMIVAKTIEYKTDPELGIWQNRIMMVADDDRIGTSCGGAENTLHTMYSEALIRDSYPKVFDPVRIYLTEYPLTATGLKPGARADFIKNINDGVLITNYVGHGDQYRMAQEEVFNPNSVPLISAGRRQTFLVAASCNVSRFDEAASSSMAEELLRRAEGGTIGSLASTHLCLPYPNQMLNSNFIKAIFGFTGEKFPVIPVADAAQIGKALTAAWQLAFFSNSEMYALLGDPGLELASPSLDVTFESAPADTLQRKGTYEMSCRVTDGGEPVTSFEGSAEMRLREAADTSGYESCSGIFIKYDLAGRLIHRGRMDVVDGAFDFGMLVSVDASEGRDGSLRCFVTDGQSSGSGVLDNLFIRGESMASDNLGPEISLEGAGRVLENGDTVSVGETIRVKMSDDSGVAIKSKSEFIASVSVYVDDGDGQDITDSVYAVGGDFTQSVASFVVPSLSIDTHKFTLKAFDNLSNLQTRDYTFVVEAGGDEATNLVYAYPNPVGDRCYLICQYDRRVLVDAVMYTVSGRKIWATTSSAADAYHELLWDGTDSQGDQVSNGTYIVKVTARDPNDAGYKAEKTITIAVIR
jgi:hypothetical protein